MGRILYCLDIMSPEITTPAPALAYNIDTAAAAVALSRESISRAISSGALRAHYPTSRPTILRDDLLAWIAQSPTNASNRKADRDLGTTLPGLEG